MADTEARAAVASDRYVKETLTAHQQTVWAFYVRMSSKPFNTFLRHEPYIMSRSMEAAVDERLGGDLEKAVRTLQGVLEHAPRLEEHAFVYRGGDEMMMDAAQRTERGIVVTYPAFVSTSFDPGVAAEYVPTGGECCEARLMVPAGTRALYAPEHRQLVLAPGTRILYLPRMEEFDQIRRVIIVYGCVLPAPA